MHQVAFYDGPHQAGIGSAPLLRGLMNLLAGSDRVQQCLTWKVAQFALGRPLGSADSRTLDKVHQAAQKGGGTYASLMRAIIKSDLVQKTQTEPN